MSEREPQPNLLKTFGENYWTKCVALAFTSAVVVGATGLWPSSIPRKEIIEIGFWGSMAIFFAGRLAKTAIDVSREKAAPEL